MHALTAILWLLFCLPGSLSRETFDGRIGGSVVATPTSPPVAIRCSVVGVIVIEERNGACPGPNCDVRVRYHVNGGQYVDEHVATFDDASAAFAYYVHNDLYSVVAVADASGTVIESYDYGGYGLSAISGSAGCQPGDMDGDSVVDAADLPQFITVLLEGTTDPHELCAADLNTDGQRDGLDIQPMVTCLTGGPCPPPVAGGSPVRTPYTLHGRPVDVLDGGNLILQYNRARYYDIKNGRWLQRDQSGYHDGPNLYEAFGDNPAYFLDPSGLWLARRIAEIVNEKGQLTVGDIKMLGEELQKFPNQLAALTDEEIQLLAIIGGPQYGTPWTESTLSPALRAEADERFPNLQPMWRYRIQANLSTRRRMLFTLLFQRASFANYVTELYRLSRDLNPVHFAAERGIQIGTGTETITGQKVSRLRAGAEFVVYLALLKGAQVGPAAITRAAGGEVPKGVGFTSAPTGPGQRVRVYRVEGTPNTRIAVDEHGGVAIVDESKTLFLNFGSRARAEEFFAQRLSQGLPGAQIKSFEVTKAFVDELRASAVGEFKATAAPGQPIRVDITKAPDQFGLRPEQIKALQDAIIQGTGKVEP